MDTAVVCEIPGQGSVVKFLTIIVPTYNRSGTLRQLLTCLREETLSLRDRIDVIVSDNASTDDTESIVRAMHDQWPELIVIRQARNVGADENFCSCVERVTGGYFWIIGDDDLPRKGVVAMVLELLTDRQPDLLYMQSEWVDVIGGPGPLVDRMQVESLDDKGFAEAVHVWLTFISGLIISHDALLKALGGHSIRRYTGTYLVQLGWVLPVLRSGSTFVRVMKPCVLATRNNTGGYAVLTVFGVNFPRIVREEFGERSSIGRVLVSRTVRDYLPGLIRAARAAGRDRFAMEDPWHAMRRELGHDPLFWFLLLPLGKLPSGMAWILYAGWRLAARVGRMLRGGRQGRQT